MPSSEINYQLQQAIALAQAGQREEARRLLQQIVNFDPTTVAAWLWLATVAATQTERIYALQQVLNLDPNNEKARVALAQLGVGEPVDEASMFPFDSDEDSETRSTVRMQSGFDGTKPPPLLSPRELIIVVTVLVVVAIFVSVIVYREVGGGTDATPTPRATATPLPLPTALPTTTFTPSPTNTFPAPRTLPPVFTPTPTLTPSVTPTFTPTPAPLDGSIFGG